MKTSLTLEDDGDTLMVEDELGKGPLLTITDEDGNTASYVLGRSELKVLVAYLDTLV